MSPAYYRGPLHENAMNLRHDHIGFKVQWAPDRDLNPGLEDKPDIPWCGLIIEHFTPLGEACVSHITFDLPGTADWNNHKWEVVSFDPLHVEPSILCDCGDHGFIRNGQWEPA